MNVKSAQSGIVIFCVLITAALTGVVVWQFSVLHQAQEEWHVKQTQRDDLKAEIIQVEEMLWIMEQEQKEFSKYFFKERDIPSFLDEISKFANDSLVGIVDMKTKNFSQVRVSKNYSQANENAAEVNIEQMRQQQKEQILTLSAMPIQIKVEGTFSALVDFLGLLQDYEQLISISSVDIQAQREYPKLSCNFTLSIYSLKTLEELRVR